MGRRRGAFTLIELLVVIAIIAILIGFLLPSLKLARESGRKSVCLSNQKQIAAAMFTYSVDFEVIPGITWQGVINLDWAGRNNAAYLQDPDAWHHPFATSVLFPYLSHYDKILECPTGQREANTFFDYTMLARMAGARTDLQWRMSYPLFPEQNMASEREYFQALPLLVEEHGRWYNSQVDDGTFAWYDQFSDRHGGEGSIAFLDGSAGHFDPPTGPVWALKEQEDLEVRDLRLHVGSRLFPVYNTSAQEYGWANRPR